MNKRINLYNNNSDCCGCTACYSICPKNAISMLEDKEGFKYPSINMDMCISCHLCEKVCAFKQSKSIKKKNNVSKPQTFAVKHKNLNVRLNSRSGGIFTDLSDYFLKNDGVIYGCILDNTLVVKHIRATNETQRNLMRGSKYVQSDLFNTFAQVKNDLDGSKYVLFTGTSCQIDGLKSFLGKKYEKLLCVDILCHGVPSPMIFKDFIDWSEKKYDGKVIDVDFRNKKDFGWASHVETLSLKKNNNVFKKIQLCLEHFFMNTIYYDRHVMNVLIRVYITLVI